MKRIPATMERAREGWQHIPLVKLGEILKQMIWFDGNCILNISRDSYESTNHEVTPQSASLDIQYRKQQITINCIWEMRETPYHSAEKYPDRFAIGISEPYHRDFQIQRWRVDNAIRYKYSRYYSTAIDRIEDAIYAAQKVIDEKIAERELVQRQVDKAASASVSLCKSLDVEIISSDQELAYRENNEYCLRFLLSENGLYKINHIGGEYTEAEIKKIIELVGGNPRAIAERLSK